MGRPVTLLEGLCGHALALGVDFLEIGFEDGHVVVYARQGPTRVSIARYKRGSRDAKELLDGLYAAARRPFRTVLHGKRSILRVAIRESFGADAFDVRIQEAAPLDPAAPPAFTPKQGQYLTYIDHYTKLHKRPPAEAEMQEFFGVTPPTVHTMIQTLERNGFIER